MELIRAGRRHFSPSEREQLLAAYRHSGQTQREFASRHGLSLSCLVVWLRQSRQRPSAPVPPPFMALPGGLPASSPPRAYTIQFPGGHRLEVARGWERVELEELCQILHRL